jgi:plasmid stability protein
MKNVTVSLDDETYRNARVRAAELGTSISALVRRFLTDLGSSESHLARLKREERALRSQVPRGFSARHNLPRDRLHDRDP